jgi:hypothetical protein
MGKDRLRNPVIPSPIDYTPKGNKGTKEVTLTFSPCLNCHKTILEGYYGRWGNGGVCSKTCNEAQMKKRLDEGERNEEMALRSRDPAGAQLPCD